MHHIKLYLDIFFVIGVFLNAALFVPQIILLCKTRKANGLSLPMFLGFNFIQLVTAIHGYIVNDYILMWGYILSFITCGIITVLIIIFKNK